MYEMKACAPAGIEARAWTEKVKVRGSKWYAAFGVQLLPP